MATLLPKMKIMKNYTKSKVLAQSWNVNLAESSQKKRVLYTDTVVTRYWGKNVEVGIVRGRELGRKMVQAWLHMLIWVFSRWNHSLHRWKKRAGASLLLLLLPILEETTLLPISEFVLNEKFQQNGSKFAIFYTN